jgi:hypothetical protein
VVANKSSAVADIESTEPTAPNKAAKRLPQGSLHLQFAGELVLVRNPTRALAGLFRRYEALFEAFANMARPERAINYRFLSALMLTSHAKKCASIDERKRLFDMKNAIFLNLANDRETRRKLAFRYLTSKKFRVVEFCADCRTKNTGSELPQHQWKHCKYCKVDRNFYNVVSMHHKFEEGSATLFLSNDRIPEIKGLQITKKGRLDDITEEALFQRYHYNIGNLDAISLASVLAWHDKLMATPIPQS